MEEIHQKAEKGESKDLLKEEKKKLEKELERLQLAVSYTHLTLPTKRIV